MTPTEKAKRAEALYYDNHNITRRTLCNRIANLEADLEDARAENAKLRKLVIAKLRKLVRDMWFWGYEGHMDSKSQEWQMKHIEGVLDCMKQLGVEVGK